MKVKASQHQNWRAVQVGAVHQENSNEVVDDGPSNENEGIMYIQCALCLEEVMEIANEKGSASPREYQRISVSYTPRGFQVWCNRHDCNVMHVDFQGATHPANLTRKKQPRDNNN